MQSKVFKTPSLYGDHHVSELRKHLLAIPGIADVYASSAFQVVEVKYDEKQISETDILNHLLKLGYLNELEVTQELETAVDSLASDNVFRHTINYAHLKGTVGFQHNVSSGTNPAWACPGLPELTNSKN